MNVQTPSDPLNPQTEECLRLHKCWLWFVCLGIALMVVGGMAVGAAFIATMTTVIVFGSLLLAGGVVQLLNAFVAGSWKGFLVHFLVAILHLIVGGLMIEKPLRAAEALTLMVTVALLIGGMARIILALKESFADRWWVLLNGIVTLALGIMIWRQWPASSLWVIGLFVGIDMIFNGWSWVMLGLIVKSAAPPTHTGTHAGSQNVAGAVH